MQQLSTDQNLSAADHPSTISNGWSCFSAVSENAVAKIEDVTVFQTDSSNLWLTLSWYSRLTAYCWLKQFLDEQSRDFGCRAAQNGSKSLVLVVLLLPNLRCLEILHISTKVSTSASQLTQSLSVFHCHKTYFMPDIFISRIHLLPSESKIAVETAKVVCSVAPVCWTNLPLARSCLSFFFLHF